MDKPYKLAANNFSQDEISAAKAVLDSGDLTMGKRVVEFENSFKNYLGVKHAIMVNSGSSANLLMFEVLVRRSRGEPLLQPGDKVIVPALSWPTTVWPIVQLGLVPVFVDIDPKTLAIDLKSSEQVYDPKVKAMILINILGQPPNLPEYVAFCNQRNMILLEDNCESLGAKSNGAFLGSFGSMASFSMYFSHHISTIEGGMIVTNDDSFADDLRSARSHGWIRDRSDRQEWIEKYPDIDERFLFITTGYNFRPTEIQAAIGLVQLKKLDKFIDSRAELVQKVSEIAKASAPWLKIIGQDYLSEESVNNQENVHTWMTIPFYIDRSSGVLTKKVMKHLEEYGVECRSIIAGNLTRHPACRNIKSEVAPSLAVCDSIFENGFMIGCHPLELEESIETISRAFQAFRLEDVR